MQPIKQVWCWGWRELSGIIIINHAGDSVVFSIAIVNHTFDGTLPNGFNVPPHIASRVTKYNLGGGRGVKDEDEKQGVLMRKLS